MFGNVEFVGELFRRRILPKTILVNIFELLLGLKENDSKTDDLTVEAAIKLMNKVGYLFDQANENKNKENQNFTNIMD